MSRIEGLLITALRRRQALTTMQMNKQLKVPFLRPALPVAASYQSYLEQIDRAGVYSNFGPLIRHLEDEIASRFFGPAGHVVTVANATLGLMLAINAVKRPGARYALMPSFTFAATPLAAMWCGLVPYFVDIRPGDWSLDEEKVREKLDQIGDDVAVVVPYATFGSAIDLSFYAGLHQSGTPVVVDAAPGAGSFNKGIHLGRGVPGAVVYSLHATKPFGVGEGGFVYSASESIVEAVRCCSNFGFDGDRVSTMPGLNAKMSEYAAAIGLAAIEEIAGKAAARRRIYDWYLEDFSSADLSGNGWVLHSYTGDGAPQFTSVLCPPGMTGGVIAGELARDGIGARTYFSPPCHLQPAFAEACWDDLSETEAVCARVLSLPLWVGMTRADVRRVINGMRDVVEKTRGFTEGVLNVDTR